MSHQQKEPALLEADRAVTCDERGRVKRQSIAIVSGSLVTLPDGETFRFDSPQGKKWFQAVISFRFESSLGHSSFTARKQESNGLFYWYGTRKTDSKLKRKYIGTNSSKIVTIQRLEKVAEGLSDNTVESLRLHIKSLRKQLNKAKEELVEACDLLKTDG